jgi:hypothetical protein
LEVSSSFPAAQTEGFAGHVQNQNLPDSHQLSKYRYFVAIVCGCGANDTVFTANYAIITADYVAIVAAG